MPRISVVVPVYKVEKYLRRCVDSILQQTFTDFDMVLVDDGSPDRSGDICDEYAKNNACITVIHQENSGVSAARNTGIDWVMENSDSEWLTFIDSDDWIHPKYLETLYGAVKETELKISVCGFENTEGEVLSAQEDGMQVQIWNSREFFLKHDLNAILIWGKLYCKDSFKEIRYPVGKIHEDESTTYKILLQYDRIAVVPAQLYAYFRNPEGITGSEMTLSRSDVFDMFEERADFFLKQGDDELYQRTIRGLMAEMYKRMINYDKISKADFKMLRKRYWKYLIKYEKWRLLHKERGYYKDLFAVMHPRFLKYYRKMFNIRKR